MSPVHRYTFAYFTAVFCSACGFGSASALDNGYGEPCAAPRQGTEQVAPGAAVQAPTSASSSAVSQCAATASASRSYSASRS
jgi:hypothetical protein